MSYNGSGTFNINTAGQPVVTGTVISSTAFNALTADLGTGLSTAITKNGQTTVTANIPFNGYKLTGIAVATASGDALSYGQAATVSTLTDSALTSGRVPYASTAGLFVDSANLTFNGTTLTAAGFSGPISGVVTSTSITDSGLTSGRVTYAGTGGLLKDSANLTFSGTALTITGSLNVSLGSAGTIASFSDGIAQTIQIFTATGYAGFLNANNGDIVFRNYNNTSDFLRITNAGNLQANYADASIHGLTVGLGGGSVSTNTAVGVSALASNTTASNNTAVGYQAGYSTTGSPSNVFLGYQAGYSATAGYNTFVGKDAGRLVTSGAGNVILGAYTGSAAPISATGSNYIVLSDGDGNVRGYFDNNGQLLVTGGVQSQFNASSGSYNFYISGANSAGSNAILNLSASGSNSAVLTYVRSSSQLTIVNGGSGGVYLASGGVAWVAISDERQKENLIPIADAITKVSSLRAVTGNLISDPNKKSKAFLIAQDVEKVLPEAVDNSDPEVMGLAYTDVIPLLVAAIKELSAKVAQLESKLVI